MFGVVLGGYGRVVVKQGRCGVSAQSVRGPGQGLCSGRVGEVTRLAKQQEGLRGAAVL